MGGEEESDGHLERRMDISLELDPLKQHEREQRWKQGGTDVHGGYEIPLPRYMISERATLRTLWRLSYSFELSVRRGE